MNLHRQVRGQETCDPHDTSLIPALD